MYNALYCYVLHYFNAIALYIVMLALYIVMSALYIVNNRAEGEKI